MSLSLPVIAAQWRFVSSSSTAARSGSARRLSSAVSRKPQAMTRVLPPGSRAENIGRPAYSASSAASQEKAAPKSSPGAPPRGFRALSAPFSTRVTAKAASRFS